MFAKLDGWVSETGGQIIELLNYRIVQLLNWLVAELFSSSVV